MSVETPGGQKMEGRKWTVDSPFTGSVVTSSCEPPNTGVGNCIQVL